jgi:hypothetical protein
MLSFCKGFSLNENYFRLFSHFFQFLPFFFKTYRQNQPGLGPMLSFYPGFRPNGGLLFSAIFFRKFFGNFDQK